MAARQGVICERPPPNTRSVKILAAHFPLRSMCSPLSRTMEIVTSSFTGAIIPSSSDKGNCAPEVQTSVFVRRGVPCEPFFHIGIS